MPTIDDLRLTAQSTKRVFRNAPRTAPSDDRATPNDTIGGMTTSRGMISILKLSTERTETVIKGMRPTGSYLAELRAVVLQAAAIRLRVRLIWAVRNTDTLQEDEISAIFFKLATKY